MNNLYLAHHGVKGMKWGVRRAKKKEARARYKADVSEAIKTAEAAGDYRSAKKMKAVTNPTKAAIKSVATGVGTSVAGAVVAEAGRQALEKKLYSDLPKSSVTSGEMMSLNIINGAFGGVVTGSLGARAQYKAGVKIAAEKYGVDVKDYKVKEE